MVVGKLLDCEKIFFPRNFSASFLLLQFRGCTISFLFSRRIFIIFHFSEASSLRKTFSILKDSKLEVNIVTLISPFSPIGEPKVPTWTRLDLLKCYSDGLDSGSLEFSEFESSTTSGAGTSSLLVSSDFAESAWAVLSAGATVFSDVFDSEFESSTTSGAGTSSCLLYSY